MISTWDDEEEAWRYQCWRCVAQAQGFTTEGEARGYIYEKSRAFQRKDLRAKKYLQARQEVKELFPMITDAREVRSATRKSMQLLFEPMADAIVRKCRHHEQLNKNHAETKRMLQGLRNNKDPEAVRELLARQPNIAVLEIGITTTLLSSANVTIASVYYLYI